MFAARLKESGCATHSRSGHLISDSVNQKVVTFEDII